MTDVLQRTEAEPGAPEPHDEADPPSAGLPGLLLLVGSLVALGVFASWIWVLTIVALVFMIFMHELGHYLTARAAGIKVTEFFIFFGPRIWSFKRGETEYGIKLIPLGAYVKVVGMTNFEEVDPAEESRTYRQKPYWRRLSVAVAGSAMHFMMAIVMLFVFLVAYGQLPGTDDAWEVSAVTPASAAERAGIQPGDRLVSINGQDATVFEDLRDVLEPFAGEEVTIIYERDGESVTASTVIGERLTVAGAAAIDGLLPNDVVTAVDGVAVTTYDEMIAAVGDRIGEPVPVSVYSEPAPVDYVAVFDGPVEGGARGFLGVGPDFVQKDVGFFAAIPRAFVDFADLTWQSIKAEINFFRPSNIGGFISGAFESGETAVELPADLTPLDAERLTTEAVEPIDENRILSMYGVIRLGNQQARDGGLAGFLTFFALINIFIGVFNLTPILPFDGGHVLIATYEKVRSTISGKRHFADITKMLPAVYAVMALFLVLVLVSHYRDIFDPIA